MKHHTIKDVLWSVCILFPLGATAQGFDTELRISNSEDTYWYRISSALPGLETYAVTDYSDKDELCPAQLLPTEEADPKSQWKLIAGAEGRIILVNRGTGQELDGKSVSMDNFNATMIMPAGTSSGFQVTALGESVFQIESVEDDSINRCLAVADMDALPIAYPQENLSTSAVGWKFQPVEVESETGIGSPANSRTVIRITDKRISLNSGIKWQLFNARGEEMPRTIRLITGVYLVKVGEKTVKVYIP